MFYMTLRMVFLLQISVCNNQQFLFSLSAKIRRSYKKHARVLTVRNAPSLKKWRDFRRSSEQKRLRPLYAF